jgi:hypothetical protein
MQNVNILKRRNSSIKQAIMIISLLQRTIFDERGGCLKAALGELLACRFEIYPAADSINAVVQARRDNGRVFVRSSITPLSCYVHTVTSTDLYTVV